MLSTIQCTQVSVSVEVTQVNVIYACLTSAIFYNYLNLRTSEMYQTPLNTYMCGSV